MHVYLHTPDQVCIETRHHRVLLPLVTFRELLSTASLSKLRDLPATHKKRARTNTSRARSQHSSTDSTLS